MQSRSRSTASVSLPAEDSDIHTSAHGPALENGVHAYTNGDKPQGGTLDAESTNEESRTSKKRKFVTASSSIKDDGATRHVSPPWKKIAVEGPTSFVEGGRRKSSRTNLVPLELQPPSEKRQTRSRLSGPNVSRSRYGGASIAAAHSPVAVTQYASTNTTKSSLHGAKGLPARHLAGKSPAHGSASKSRNVASPAKTSSSSRRKSAVNSSKPHTPSKRPTNAKAPANPHNTRRSGRTSRRITAREVESPDASSSSSSNQYSSTEPEELDPHAKTPRLKFRVKMPKVPIQSPGHLLPPRKYASFQEWLQIDDPLSGENVRRMTDEDAKREARMRARILEEGRPGGLLSKERCTIYMPDPQEEPDRQYAHHDHLVSQALNFKSLMEKEHKRLMNDARKIAVSAAIEWKRRQPKTKEEIAREQFEAQVIRYKQLRRDLVAKWDLVAADVNRKRLIKWEEEQQVLGKQALNDMLEHSTQLLDARRARQSSELQSEDDYGDGSVDDRADQGTDDQDDDDTGGSEHRDESNMSTSESDSEEVAQGDNLDDDEGLTVDQLRRKYAMAPQYRPEDGSDAVSHSSVKSAAALGRSVSKDVSMADNNDHDALEGKDIELEQVDAALLDDSDESTDMSTDMGESSDEEDEDEESQSDEEVGLLGFLAPKERKRSSMSVDQELVEASELKNDHAADPLRIESSVVLHDQDETMDLDESHSHRLDPASPATIVTAKPSTGSGSSGDLLDHSQHPSSTTTPQPSYHLKTPIPSVLLRGTLREYQHYGLDWLAGLYANGTNGILADEMGLGKTIQTIALLAHLATVHEAWGPHLIVVPTSVMLNWEMEFKKWCPGFKILTYYGTQEERKQKRKGWMDNNLWHVCITSYQLVLQDQHAFKRRQWHYMVLDEAHHIKNFRSQRWQTLLTFRTRARLLLTGTPLQNNLTELWSLLFFLMPNDSAERGIGGFADLQAFSEWFKRPVEQILEHGRETLDDESRSIVGKLHKVLRPYLLRRLKADVEKQMPAKIEHVTYCRTSKRQRQLYNEFMSRTQTKESFASGSYLSVINCLMQLRKVCNHPDLFETRQIVTSFAMPKSAVADFEIKELLVRKRLLQSDQFYQVNLGFLNLTPAKEERLSWFTAKETARLSALHALNDLHAMQLKRTREVPSADYSSVQSSLESLDFANKISRLDELAHLTLKNSLRAQKQPIYGSGLLDRLSVPSGLDAMLERPKSVRQLGDWFSEYSNVTKSMVPTLADRSESLELAIQKFGCVTPKVVAPDLVPLTLTRRGVLAVQEAQQQFQQDAFHEARTRLSIAFPDKRLLQYDCGKLQRLDKLLRDLQAGGHRALIFTQMTKVLDILEQFLNIHGHRYLRLDGATKVEQRQVLTERFNNDTRILAFILSSRSGGLGINLTGADTVIFYDLDWNPAMDKQCQDRCHRIGQTRDVHIYRFVSEDTIEANILKKANQKQMLDDVVIQEGDFTTDYFNRLSLRDMLGEDATALEDDPSASSALDRVLGVPGGNGNVGKVLEQVEDREDKNAASVAEKEIILADNADFEEAKSGAASASAMASTPAAVAARAPAGSTLADLDTTIARAVTPKTPLVGTPRDLMPPPASTTVSTPTTDKPITPTMDASDATLLDAANSHPPSNLVHGDGTTAAAYGDDEDEEEEPGHVDGYMQRFMEYDLQNTPLDIPVDKSKAKSKGKNAHRVRSRR
ncbi:MAG: hypothetical protein M1825_000414 [Sarcosagium campestre]|nr:MAG: hypothetical protein M1825_000414 [Sarcosagium campestre]